MQELLCDIQELGIQYFMNAVPTAVALRGKAKIKALECDGEPMPQQAPGYILAGQETSGSLFLGKVVAAACRQDQLTADDNLRKVVLEARRGEPLKELEPDKAAPSAGKSALKSKWIMALSYLFLD